MTAGNSKEAYTILKALIKTQQHKSAVIEDKIGKILTESTPVLKRWTEYFSELCPDTSLFQGNQKG